MATAGNLKFDSHRQRLDGFRERLEELGFPAEQVIVRKTYNDYETTFRAVTELLETRLELRGIYMANLSVSGFCAVIQRTGKTG